ncbi:hypothetical protein [Nocardioides marmotae]|uniref:Lipoprotein n=1 Tax=Nocardioides marmotae TaxID=2663857 RepID=A0A6I3J976_9ACTN|nr:hypothetical protein [Nocardioides marmotae]MCR6030464.1 hypothetical protein [Gordonia jinghuaiqii]MBC9734596.1 hypothetical protein [Nocardioides marmotae]MTB85697.1 hypothetical protein [Nocardioides marmotae]MTB94100.1 hypothetical protein [Nocardioides marmotae]QKE00401.1 hypothetical protein HPC71_04380 [Nocardioides marmotae]
MKQTRPLLGLAAVSLLASGLLTGCGVAGTGFAPGVAAEVGDTAITTDRVDTIAASYCDAITPQLEGQVLPNRYLTSGVAGQLALAAAAEQMAAEHGVEPGQQYAGQVARLEAAVAALPEDQREAVVEVESTNSLVSDLVLGVGRVLAEEQGLADPTEEQVAGLGNEALAAWIEDNDVEINPRYGVELRDGQPLDTDTETSVAVGEVASAAMAESPDPVYAAALPDSQRCG